MNNTTRKVEKEFVAAFNKPYKVDGKVTVFALYGQLYSGVMMTDLYMTALQTLSILDKKIITKDIPIQIYDSENTVCGVYTIHCIFNRGRFSYSYRLDKQLISYLKSIRKARYGR